MKTANTAGDQLLVAEQRIDWILSNPATSDCLKSALRSARCRDPIDTLNDLELLETLLQYRSQVLIDRLLGTSGSDHANKHAAAGSESA